ncbi:DUF5979 domain-containing protein [Microbacterium sp. CFH 31415]|uniref:DUF5979 domain-containing protein n=1 Tax=Microbacterium sp. CFH 31415 TaxID=2921732 RepID=UPI001F146F37|nr:DUF5979 domain-containing protein [Microbacterium sp. CFH 31415]MCH6230390.1 DUF5979 domain-containing protein [Microbacterium sp. CFH 31415]
MTESVRPRIRRILAGISAALLAVTGVVVTGELTVAPAAAAYPESVNPFAIAGGFTVYAREDALLQNQETEGSIAVGGTATVQGSSGQYTIIHVSAGTGDYDLPTVDGDPTRFLVGQYSTTSRGILAITSAGTTDPARWGALKMVQRDGGWRAFARADWLRLNQNPANVDQTPLIDATHQQYPADAVPPTGASGNGSIYTVNTSPTAVADYVEANRDASWEEADSCLTDIADPTGDLGNPVGVAEDVGSRKVLEPLSADQPNVVDYADIAGAALLQFSPGPTPGVSNPLVIRVPAGTTEVVGARADPQGAFSPYILWDLSQLTGDVTVRAAEARIDGSVYAPDASVTVDAAPLDGQVVGLNVTLKGGEAHSFLFSSEIPCAADSGTFAIRKELAGITPTDLPEGTTFTVNYVATTPDDAVTTGTLEVPADGTPVLAGEQFPLGTVVEFEEIAPETEPGWEWTGSSITPNPLIVGAGTSQVVVTNSAEEQVGTFSLQKLIVDVSGGDPGEPSQTTVPVTWTAFSGGDQIGEGTVQVPFDGTTVVVEEDFPVGTRIVLTEDLTGIDPPPGYEWSGVGWSPGRTFVIDETGTSVAVELTNAVAPVSTPRTITIVKSATGPAADPGFEYTVTYNGDPDGALVELPLPPGEPQLITVQTGAGALLLTELAPTFNGTPVDTSSWNDPVFTISTPSGSTSLTAAFGETVEIPLPDDSSDIAIEVANSLKEGTFTLSKEFTGIPPVAVPEGREFSVRWTATLPTGEVETGVVRLPGDSTPVGPVDSSGAPLLFPYGTVVTFEELPAPTPRGVQWESATFDPAELVIGADDAEVVESTLVNDGSLLSGTFQVEKSLDGIDPDDLLVDSFTIGYVAFVPGPSVEAGRFEVPADGTPGGPVFDNGDPITFPIGTVVYLTEEEPNPAALPAGYEWGETVWRPSSSVRIGLGGTPVLEVTNTAVQLTRWEVTKVMDGDGASAVPAGTTFPIEWWWDYEPQPDFSLAPNEPVYSPYFPVGSIIQGREGALPDIPGVDWGDPTWTLDGEQLVPDDNGIVTLPMSASRRQGLAQLTLTNTAATLPLPTTGGGPIPPLVPFGGLGLIALGALLVIRRTGRSREASPEPTSG